jgi:hypothetical protein
MLDHLCRRSRTCSVVEGLDPAIVRARQVRDWRQRELEQLDPRSANAQANLSRARGLLRVVLDQHVAAPLQLGDVEEEVSA